jgi:hypothetical protein
VSDRSSLRWALVALLAASTILFAVGVAIEPSDTNGGEGAAEAAHSETDEREEAGEAVGAEPGESAGHAEDEDEGEEGGEELLGIDLESTPLVVLAVLTGLALAALVATPIGTLRAFLILAAGVALVWAALDVREALHQIDESNTGIALIAGAVAALHLAAAATAGRLSTLAAPRG